MSISPPDWAFRAASPEDHSLAQTAHRQHQMRITWPEAKALRTWAKQQHWNTPFFGFETAFIAQMLENAANFALAIRESGIAISLPKQQHTIDEAQLAELDALYTQRDPSGRPGDWGILVEELREIRRAIELGVAVTIAGEPKPLRGWQSFYQWAHGRYHMLEDGYDAWIGDDR